jgi:RNA polymerase sigma factor (sigma-70 family)
MADSRLAAVLGYLRRRASSWGTKHESDAHLVRQFAGSRDPDAFDTLVRRHGALVWHVCRRLLGKTDLADDAFQATWLVFARRAGAIRRPAALSSWLHGVAYRMAREVRGRRKDNQVVETRDRPAPACDPAVEAAGRELGRLIEEEVADLPEALRLVVLLCYWEGLSNEEAAQRLGWPCGTVKTRLARARSELHSRLTARGVSLPGGVLALLMAPAGASEAAPAVSAGVNSQAAALAQMALRGSALAGYRSVAVLLLVLSAVALGFGARTQEYSKEQPPREQDESPAAAVPKASNQATTRLDSYGDPLPSGALLRLGTVRLRDAPSFLSFLPGDRTLLSIADSPENSARVWDVVSGREVRRLEAPHGYFLGHALSRDGKTLALSSTNKDQVQIVLRDVDSGKEVRRLDGLLHKSVRPLSFSPDGRTLAGACGDETIRLWDLATGREVLSLHASKTFVIHLSFSPDGSTLASGGSDGTVRLWDVALVKSAATAPAGPPAVRRERLILGKASEKPGEPGAPSLAFSPDGTTLASASSDAKAVQLWDTASGKLLRRLECRGKDYIRCVAFSPDGKLLACGSGFEESCIQLWDPATGEERCRIQENHWATGPFAFSSDGRCLAAGSGDGTIRLWNTATAKEIRPRGAHQGSVFALSYSPDGKMLATGCRDRMVRLWDADTGKLLRRLRADEKGVLCAVFSTDGKTLVTGGGENKIRFWDIGSGSQLRELDAHPGTGRFAFALAVFSPDGKMLATTGADRFIRLWRTHTDEPLRRMEVRGANVNCMAFSPDGRLLVSGDGDPTGAQGAVRLWEVATGKEVRHCEPGPRWCSSVAFSPDGKTLAAAGFSRDIHLWDVATGTERMRLRIPLTRNGPALAFSPDGRMLASVAGDSLVRLWEVATGHHRASFEGHQFGVDAVAFSPDGRRLASGSYDTTVLVWDVTAGQRVSEMPKLDLQARWEDLAAKNGARAWQAIQALAASPREAVPFLHERLRPVQNVARARVMQLIADLDSEDFTTRRKAAEQIESLGELAVAGLRKSLEDKPTAEVRRQVLRLLEDAAVLTPGRLRLLRAIEALEYAATPEARIFLEELARGAPQARLTLEARAALHWMQKPPAALP